MKFFKLCLITIAYISSDLYADSNISKDWIWDISGKEFFYAATLTPEGRLFGKYCYHEDGMCYYLVNLGAQCKEGDQYPSIVNSEAGTASVTLFCGHKLEDGNVFYVSPFEEVARIAVKADKIAFAIAMDDGTFKVVRFSLAGSNHAIAMMTAAAELLYQSRSGKIETNKAKVKSEEYL